MKPSNYFLTIIISSICFISAKNFAAQNLTPVSAEAESFWVCAQNQFDIPNGYYVDKRVMVPTFYPVSPCKNWGQQRLLLKKIKGQSFWACPLYRSSAPDGYRVDRIGNNSCGCSKIQAREHLYANGTKSGGVVATCVQKGPKAVLYKKM